MSIKKGISKGDLVYISSISPKDVLHSYGGTRVRGYCSESDYKLTSLVGMVGRLMGYREPEGKNNKTGMTKAVVRFTLPDNFFVFDEDMRYYNRMYNPKADENKGVKMAKFDVLFSTGVRLEQVSLMPSDLRYGYAVNELAREHVRGASSMPDNECWYESESDFIPETYSTGKS
tara:strand:- start:763 stop:1284 length:522 start_codon:yes stop_codon:yes gene_type:complete